MLTSHSMRCRRAQSGRGRSSLATTGRLLLPCLALAVLIPGMALGDGAEVISHGLPDGCYDVNTFGIGMYGTGSGSTIWNSPGTVVKAYLHWVGVSDETPPGATTSSLNIVTPATGPGGVDVMGTLNTGTAGISSVPDWYSWYADIGPGGAGLIFGGPGSGGPITVRGWDNASLNATNGATLTIIYDTAPCAFDATVELQFGVDWYYHGTMGEEFSDLLVFDFAPVPVERSMKFHLAHAGTQNPQSSCRSGSIWFVAGTGAPPLPASLDIASIGAMGRARGQNGGIEIVKNPFTSASPTLPCTLIPEPNPPDEPYLPGPCDNGPGVPAFCDYGLDPAVVPNIIPSSGGDVGPEWGVLEVHAVVPANTEWVAFQLESASDVDGESGSWSGGAFITAPMDVLCEPIIVCKQCEVCNDEGQCWAHVPCEDIACAFDGSGNPIPVICDPVPPYPAGPRPGGTTTDVMVTAFADGEVIDATCPVTVIDCEPPVCEAPLDIVLQCEEACGVDASDPRIVDFIAEAMGQDNCQVTPPIITYAPPFYKSGCGAGLTTTVGFVVTDWSGYQHSCSANVTIQDTLPPDLTVPPPLVIECDSPLGVPADDPRILAWLAQATATDQCGPATVTTQGLPPIIPRSCPPGSPLQVVFVAQDTCGLVTQGESSIVVIDTLPPTLQCVPADLTVSCDEVPPPADVVAVDNCDDAVQLDFTEVITPGPCPGTYTIERHWMATDDCGNFTEATQVIEVEDDTAPVLYGTPGNVVVECDAIPPVPDVIAVDDCDPNPALLFEEEIDPGQCADQFTLTRTWTAVDHCGNETVHVQLIVVQDLTAPVLHCVPADVVVECDAVPPPPIVEATDNCDPSPIVVFVEEVQPGQCPDEYTIVRTWTATDRCDNVTEDSQTITVQDTRAPELHCVPADIVVECDAVPPAPVVTATDNCDPNPVVGFVEVIEPGPCPNQFTIRRTWTATDRCGNASNDEQVIMVQDTTPPVLHCVPEDVVVECDEIPPEPIIEATDNCDPEVLVNLHQVLFPGDCADSYTIERVWTAVDSCGNPVADSQTITVQDTTPPTIEQCRFLLLPDLCEPIEPPEPPENSRGVSSARVEISCGCIDDNCDEDPDIDVQITARYMVVENGACVEHEDVYDNLSCGDRFILWRLAPDCTDEPRPIPPIPVPSEFPVIFGEEITLEVTVTDNCGNSASCSDVATLDDEGVLPCVPEVPEDCDDPCILP